MSLRPSKQDQITSWIGKFQTINELESYLNSGRGRQLATQVTESSSRHHHPFIAIEYTRNRGCKAGKAVRIGWRR